MKYLQQKPDQFKKCNKSASSEYAFFCELMKHVKGKGEVNFNLVLNQGLLFVYRKELTGYFLPKHPNFQGEKLL